MKRQVLVGLDDSPASRAAHEWAARYASATGAVLRAVHVLEWPIGLAELTGKSGTRLQVPREEIAEPYWRGLRRVFGDVPSPAGSTLHVAQGDVAEVLVRLSGSAELLVLGTRQRLGTRVHRAGPVSQYCIAHAACPVMTVPAPHSDHGGWIDDSSRTRWAGTAISAAG